MPALIVGANAATSACREQVCIVLQYHPSFFAQVLVNVGLLHRHFTCMGYWVTIRKTRDIYIRCRRVPLAEVYW